MIKVDDALIEQFINEFRKGSSHLDLSKEYN